MFAVMEHSHVEPDAMRLLEAGSTRLITNKIIVTNIAIKARTASFDNPSSSLVLLVRCVVLLTGCVLICAASERRQSVGSGPAVPNSVKSPRSARMDQVICVAVRRS